MPTHNRISRREFLRRTAIAGAGVSAFGTRSAWPALAQTGGSITAQVNGKIDEFMSKSQPVGLAVGIITLNADKKPQTRTFFRGEAKRENGVTPDEKTIFELGSITKVFTATLLADMVFNQGLLALNDDVQPYYDKLSPGSVTLPTYKGQAIKFVHLATHTAGFPDDPPNLKDGGLCEYTPQLMYQALSKLTLTQPPGQVASYSNLGFGTLADCLCLIANGQPYETVLRAMLDKARLALPDTHVTTSDFADLRFAQGYTKSTADDKIVEAPMCMPTWPAFNGAGSLHATLTDALEWATFNLGLTKSPLNSLLPKLQQQRHTFGKDQYVGLGWQLRPLKALPGKYAVTKNGGTLGYSTDITFFPESGTAVVSLCNMANTDVTALGADIIEILNATN
ncbi:MAG: serine hydrolase domain-containing protein [Aggregatilineales bacterium]